MKEVVTKMIYIIESKVGMNNNNQLVDSLMKHKKHPIM